MSSFTFEQLTTGTTAEEAEQMILDLMQDQGIQTTDWKEGSPELTIVKAFAELFYTECINRTAQNALNSMNQYASGSALDALSISHFANSRSLSETTVGNIVVTGSLSIVPKTFQATELKITDGDYVFYNVNPFTLSNAIPYVTESFQAELPGAEYNIAANSTLFTVATNIGVSVFNPPITGSTTWITTTGRDEETDSTLKQRNAAKWTAAQTSELTTERVKALVLAASPELTYVSVTDTEPRGPGTVDVYCSRDTVPIIQADIDLAQAVLNQAFFNNASGTRVTAVGATAKYFDRTATVYYSANANGTTVATAVKTAIDDWIASIPIGGTYYTATLSNIASITALIKIIESVDGVSKVAFTDTSDISLLVNEKLLTPADNYASLLTFVELAFGNGA